MTAQASAVSGACKGYKIPQSVLVIIHTAELQVLLMRRADSPSGLPTEPLSHAIAHESTAFWQCVTGSKDSEQEPFAETAVREVQEETGIDARSASCVLRDWELENVYDIYPQWRHRYAPGVTRNVEHVFGLRVAADTPVCLNPREHTEYVWLPWRVAADRCFSPSNAEACLLLPRFVS